MKRILFLTILAAVFAFAAVSVSAQDTPSDFEPISARNADEVTLVQTLGRGYITDLAWSPDGDTVGVTSVTGAWLHDPDNPEAEPTLLNPTGNAMYSIAFSPDNSQIVTGDYGGRVYLWDAASLEMVNSFYIHDGAVIALAFSPDSQWVASNSYDNTISVWDVLSGELVRRFDFGDEGVFSPDGTLFAAAGVYGDTAARIWSIESHEEILLDGHDDYPTSIAFSPDGALAATVSRDNKIRLWDVAESLAAGAGVKVAEQEYGSAGFTEVLFSPDGSKVITGDGGGSITVWQVDALLAGPALGPVLYGHNNNILELAFSPDGQRIASISFDQTVRLWNISDAILTETPATPQDIIEGYSGEVMDVAFSPDGELVASASADSAIHLWETYTGNQREALRGHGGLVLTVDFNPDGTLLASGSTDGYVRLWDVETGQTRAMLQGHDNSVTSVDFSPDGATLISGGVDGTIRMWDVASGQQLQLYEMGEQRISELAFNPTGGLFAFNHDQYGDQTVRVWNVLQGREMRVLTAGDGAGLRTLAFSRDSSWLAAGGWDGSVWVWGVTSGDLEWEWHNGDIASGMAFTPDGSLLAAGMGSGIGVMLYDLYNDETYNLNSPSERENWVSGLDFNADGTLLVVGYGTGDGGGDGVVRLWGILKGVG